MTIFNDEQWLFKTRIFNWLKLIHLIRLILRFLLGF
jgi:hypothetical protein